MSLILITGISGSGKSTVMRELKVRGFKAHGVDEEGFADWVDRDTGMIVPFPHDDTDLDIHDWYKRYRWIFSIERIAKLKEQSDTHQKLVFLAGSAVGISKVWYLFDKVILLSVDEYTIRHRIEQRQDNHFGKTPQEMADILFWLKDFDNNHRRLGAHVIDATRPIQEVVDKVIALTSMSTD